MVIEQCLSGWIIRRTIDSNGREITKHICPWQGDRGIDAGRHGAKLTHGCDRQVHIHATDNQVALIVRQG